MVLRDEAVGSRRETSAPSRVFGGMKSLSLFSLPVISNECEKSLFLFRRLFGEIALMLWLLIKGTTPPALHATALPSSAA